VAREGPKALDETIRGTGGVAAAPTQLQPTLDNW
jgi:hypothetical protein